MASCPVIEVGESHSSRAWESAFRGVWEFVERRVASVWLLLACKVLIALVSAFDTYLTIKYVTSLETYEQNPMGRWLMGLDAGPVCATQQIAAFITAKFLGTILVLLAIQAVAYYRLRWAYLVAIPVTLFQMYLACHLLFGEG